MPKIKLDKELSAKFVGYLKLREAQKEAANALNREKTVVKNVFKDGIKNKQFLIGTYALAGGFRFDYNQTQSDVIDVEDFFKLYEAKEITREQLLKCISVQKAQVDNHVGSDVSLRLSTTKTGKEFDVRITELDIDAPKENVMVTPDVAAPTTRKIKPKVTAQAPAKTAIRRIKLSSKK